MSASTRHLLFVIYRSKIPPYRHRRDRGSNWRLEFSAGRLPGRSKAYEGISNGIRGEVDTEPIGEEVADADGEAPQSKIMCVYREAGK